MNELLITNKGIKITGVLCSDCKDLGKCDICTSKSRSEIIIRLRNRAASKTVLHGRPTYFSGMKTMPYTMLNAIKNGQPVVMMDSEGGFALEALLKYESMLRTT